MSCTGSKWNRGYYSKYCSLCINVYVVFAQIISKSITNNLTADREIIYCWRPRTSRRNMENGRLNMWDHDSGMLYRWKCEQLKILKLSREMWKQFCSLTQTGSSREHFIIVDLIILSDDAGKLLFIGKRNCTEVSYGIEK